MIDQDFERAQKILRPFAKKNIWRAVWIFVSTLVFLWGSIFVNFFVLQSDVKWILLISIPFSVAFMCRSFVIEHDCGHQSFFRGGRWNDLAGNAVGLGIMIPYSMWKFIHNIHHLHVGNLSLRNFNPEVWTLTVDEFKNASTFKRTMYRIMRSRVVRLIVVPTINYGLGCRVFHPKYSKNAIASVLLHNLIYFILFWFVISSVGFCTVLIIYLLPLILFFGVAAFTFYGQHQFEDTYWRTENDWNWKEATLYGASDLDSPAWFRWLVGNVVHHSAHHIFLTIPFYKLHAAQQALNAEFEFKKVSISQVWMFMGLKLWDPEKRKLVSFSEVFNKN